MPSGNHFYKDGAFREFNETAMKASMLEKITYPAGGSTDFTFEPNDYNALDDDANIDPFEDKLNEIVIYSGDEVVPISQSFTLIHTTRLWLECTMTSYDGPLNTYNIEALVEKSTGEDIVSIQPLNESGYDFSTHVEILLPPGDYRLVADSDHDGDHDR